MGNKPRFNYDHKSVESHDCAFVAEQAISNQVIEGCDPGDAFLKDVQAQIDGELSINACIANTLARYGVVQS